MKNKISSLVLVLLIFVSLCLPAIADDGEVNLVFGISPSVSTGEPISESYALFGSNGFKYDVNSDVLTDGEKAGDMNSDGWYRAYRGKSRIFVFDLGSVCSISRIEAGFMNIKGLSILAPRYVNIRISDNGTDFGTVSEYITGFDLSTSEEVRYDLSLELSDIYSARYIEIEVECAETVYCDEISVFGTKSIFGDEKKAIPDRINDDSSYLMSVIGLKNNVKLYCDSTPYTESELLPYIGYIGSSGSIDGMMFDSAAFIPKLESGDAFSVYKSFAENLFAAGGDFANLDKTVGNVYSSVGSHKKFAVFIGLPYPSVSEEPYGDIDSDGVTDYSRTVDERIAIVREFADNAINSFLANNYENIYIAGFIWSESEIDYSASNAEAELVRESTRYVRRRGLITITDFDYLASGFDEWEDLGFNGAAMRPNSAFGVSDANYYFSNAMFTEFSQSVRNNYLGVGIETDLASSYHGDNYFLAGRNYERYLYYGYREEYRNCFRIYTQDENILSEFCYADINTPKGQYLRRLYDLTYQFIHGLYKNDAPSVTVKDINLISGDSRVTTEIKVTDDDSYRGDLRIEIPVKPMNGSVAIASNKEALIYRANDGFVGNDSFTVRVNDGFNYSEEITVNVTVSEPAVNSLPEESSIVEDNSTFDEKNNSITEIVVVAVITVAFLVTIFLVSVKTKKKKK